MFDFLFKKRPAAPSATPDEPAPPQPVSSVNAANKQAELARAAGFDGQEDAALAFILQSSFADARLQAAQHIQTENGLLQLTQAMRNVDRRVSKLAQERLQRIQYHKRMHDAVQASLLEGQRLLSQTQLLPSQVAIWDKERLTLGEFGAALQQIKQELDARLQEQIDLQRQIIDLINGIKLVGESEEPVEQSKEKISQLLLHWQQVQAHMLFESAPKNLSNQVSAAIDQVQAQLEQRRINLELSASQNLNNHIEHPDVPKILPAHSDPVSKAAKIEKVEKASVVIDVEETLNSLDQALKDGQLQAALDLDKTLRQSDEKIKGEPAQKLQALRAELHRLLDWAKWGGNISREELIKFADGLTSATLSPPDIAKQVGGLRSRWKELDRTSGAAVQSLWERFDQACNSAYAVADTYFKEQARQRAANLEVAQTLLAELEQSCGAAQNPVADWKQVQATINQFKLAWRKIGTIERKVKVRLDAEFAEKLIRLTAPLTAAREAAVQVRRSLIQTVAAIQPQDRDAIDQVKNAQQRWQQEALTMPIERKDEQDLWRQFRAACDAIFEHRKAKAEQLKQQRQEIQSAKQIFCEQLESSLEKSKDEITALLKSARHEWRALSLQTRGLDGRFDAAVLALENKLGDYLKLDRQTGLANLRHRIELCQKIEMAGRSENDAGNGDDAAVLLQYQEAWKELSQCHSSPLTSALIKLLDVRFATACEQLKNQAQRNAQHDKEVLQQFQEHLLRIEAMRNLPSPAELAQQRLQMQVKDLQSALKNRNRPETYTSNLYALCTLPAVLDDESKRRLLAILEDSIAAT